MSGIDELNEAIAQGGGAYVKINRKEHGVLEGTILNAEVRGKTFEGQPVLSRKSGKQRQEWLLTLQTEHRDPEKEDDDGVRKFAANEGAQFAIRDAVKAADSKLEIGGSLKIAVTKDPASSQEQATYKAKYEAPKATEVDVFVNQKAEEDPPF